MDHTPAARAESAILHVASRFALCILAQPELPGNRLVTPFDPLALVTICPYLEVPDGGPDWQFRCVASFLFPKGWNNTKNLAAPRHSGHLVPLLPSIEYHGHGG